MNPKERKQMQKAARLAKAQAAEFDDIVRKGGRGIWDADSARGQAKVCSKMADRFTRRLAKD